MEEKVYYQDDNVKVTNLRITCNHITIPVDAIEHVTVNLRVNTLATALICFFLSFVPFYWGMKAVAPGVLLLVITSIWLMKVYRSYVEMKVTISGKRMSLIETGMNNREYVYKIETCLNDAIFDDKMEKKILIEKAKEGGDAFFSPSETLKLRQMLQEYEKK